MAKQWHLAYGEKGTRSVQKRRPIWSLWGCTINASGKYMHMENFEEYIE